MQQLDSLGRSSDCLFPCTGRHPHIDSTNLSGYLKRSGIEGITSKILRATTATVLQKLGCPLEVRQHIRHHHSHKDQLSQSYDKHDYSQEAAEWWQTLGNHLSDLEKASNIG